MQIEPLVSISEEHSKNMFENWEDFKYWLLFYSINTIEEGSWNFWPLFFWMPQINTHKSM